MLGIKRREFLELLYVKGVPYFDLNEEEIESEWVAVEQLGKELNALSRSGFRVGRQTYHAALLKAGELEE